MRYVSSFAAALAALPLLISSVSGQGSTPVLSIGNFQFVSEQRVSRTQSYFTYRADLVNTGPAITAVTATVSSTVPSVEVVAGQANLHFIPVPANSRVTSNNTFTILVDRSVPFDWANLQWSFVAPVANAGPNQTVSVGSTVTLNGSGSSNPSGIGTLAYNWTFVSRPAGTSTVLQNATTVMPKFVADVAGTYILSLTVSNGAGSDSATVVISTNNTAPVANAGPNQTVPRGSTVVLNGSGSSDVDGDPLTYAWTLVARPANSTAALTGASSVSPTFIPDQAGTYLVQLIVHDGKIGSPPSTTTITTQNTPPVANAGPNQVVNINTLVHLNGSGSTDVDGNALTYQWSLITLPPGSTAVLNNPASVTPTFTADRAGTYVAQLIVHDGQVDSTPSTVTITTNQAQAPTANAGPNQTVSHGAIVTLNGSGTDPQGLPLTFLWSLITRPSGSTAALSSTTVPGPTFVADRPGTYVAQLIVSNGSLNSTPSTVTITTTNTAPVANAGLNQNVATGVVVQLDGSASSDADQDPLSYSWSFTSRPAASNAVLTAANSPSPTFFADVPGTYVVQLIVNDGFTNSSPSTVTITATTNALGLSPSPLNLFNAPGTLTITIGTPAGSGGLQVNLASLDPSIASVQGTVLIAAGSTSASVSVTPQGLGSTTILASAAGFQPGTVTVNVAVATISLSLSSTNIGVNKTVNGTVTLAAPAPPAGVHVNLSANPGGIVDVQPSSLTIPAGQSTGAFTAQGLAEGAATITGSSAGFTSGSINVDVRQLGAVFLGSGVSVAPGQSAPISLTLAIPAPVGGVTVTLTSADTSIATVTPSVFIPEGAISPSASPQVTGVNFGSALITASAPGFTGDSKQVQVSATLALSPTNLTLGTGDKQDLTINLSGAAPSGGLTVNLSSNNTGVATVVASVTIPAGATSATAQVTAVTQGSATITATAASSNVASATATVTVVSLGTISLPSNVSVAIGQSVAFPVTLSAAAPVGGVTVTLTSSDSSKISVSPATVTIAAGATTPATQPQVTGVSAGSANITASAPGYGSATQQVTTGAQGQIGLPSNVSVALGQSLPFAITLPTPAPAGGVTVTLSSSDAGKVSISPTSVNIAAGATTPQTQPQVTGNNLGSASISASAPGYGAASQTVQVTASITLTPQNLSITGTATQNLTLTLSAPAPAGGVTFNVSSTNTGVATVPATVTIVQNSTTASIPVTGVAPGSASIRVSATNVPEVTSNVTVGAAADIILPANLVVGVGDQAVFPVTLANVAQNPVFIQLTVSDPSILSFNTANVLINAGQTAPAIAPRANGLATGTVTVTATAPGLATATTTVRVGLGLSFVPSTLDITGAGQTRSLTLTLSGPAPAGGFAVTLNSSNPGVATVPGGASFPANSTSISVPVTSVALGSATITASAASTPPATATVNVVSPGTINLPASTSVALGQSVPFAVSLSTPAPAGGVTITLSSSDAGKATVSPSTVTIPDGQTAPATQPQLTGVNVGPVNITASAQGFNPAMRTIQVNATVTWVQSTLTVGVNQTQNLQLRLSAAAPLAGLTVTLSSSSANVATVPQSVNFFPDGSQFTTVVVPVSGVAPGTTVITASGTNIPAVTANVTVVGPVSITTASLPNGQAGVAYSHTLAAAGGTSPYTWALTAGTLPAGITLNATTGQLTGTPTSAVSNAQLTFRVTDSSNPAQNASRILSLTIQPPGLAITTASLPNGQVGVLYSQTLAATGGTPPYSWAITSGTLPAGLILNASTGTISGTPSAAVTNAQVTFSVTDSANPAGTVSKSLSLTTLPAFTITTASLPNGQVNTAYSQTLTAAGGTPPYTWALTAGTLPAGLTLNASTGVLSGTPTAAVTNAPLTFRVTDSSNPAQSATKVLSLTIQPPPLAITTTALANGVVGAAYAQTLAATGGITPYTWALTAGTLPAGLTLNTSTGAISGTPGAAVTNASLQFRVMDSSNPPLTVTRTLTLTVATGLTVTTASLANGVVGTSYSQTLAAAGGTAPYTWALTAGTLPAGLTLNVSTGVISGTPTAAATNTPLTFRATDSSNPAQTATKNLTLTVIPQLTITTASLPNGQATVAYSHTLAATGGTTPYTWALVSGTLPSGLTLNTSTGQISGTPAAAVSNAQLTFRATDSGNPVQTTTKLLTLTVTPSPVSITTTSLANGQVTVGYSQTLGATGGTTPYTWALTAGTLPGGLTLDAASGQISGTPNAAVLNAQLTFRVTDSSNPAQTATKQLSLTILPAPVAITTVSLPDGQVGSAYSQMLAATGGTTPYTWALTAGTLPAGLTLNAATGQIGGTPSAPGNAQLTFRVTDSSNPQQTATKQLSLTIAPSLLSITTTSLPNGQATVGYSHTLTATGGTPGYTWALIAGNLPAGLTLNAATGHINGTPTGPASVNLTFRVMDSGNPAQTATKDLTLNVIPSPVTITTPSPLPTGQRGSPYSAMLAATGGTPPYAWALTAGTLPTGLTFSPAGVIGGTPTVSVTNLQLTFQVSDSSNPTITATKTFALTIVAPPLLITTSSLPSGQAGVAYSAQLAATGGTTPYNWSVLSGNLPAGLTLNSATGAITGIPQAAAAVSLTFRVTDSSNPLQAATSAPISLTILPPAGPAITLTNASVGLGLQATVVVQLTSPVPFDKFPVTFTSSNTNLIRVASRALDAGATGPLVVPVDAGVTSFFVFVQGFAGSGTAQLIVSAAGYTNGTATITLSPAGFVLDGPNGIGGAFIAGKNQNTGVNVRAARLDASLNFVEVQPVRGGSSATVSLSSVGVGTITPSVLIGGGDSSAPAQYASGNVSGTATLTAAAPPGFSIPAQSANTLVATVPDISLTVPNVTVGRTLQTTAQATLQGGITPVDLTVRVQSSDISKVLFSTSPIRAGAPFIDIVIPAGRNSSAEFYIYGFADTGSVFYSATASGFGTANGTVTLAPSGFAIVGGNFTTSTALGQRGLEIISGVLDGSGNIVAVQALAGSCLPLETLPCGTSVGVNVTSSLQSVGTITTSPVVFHGGEGLLSTGFLPVGVGSTTLLAVPPAGYATPAGASVVATVSNNQLLLCNSVIGQNLQQICPVILAAAAPAGGLQITLTSNNPGLLLLSASQTAAGSGSITVTVPAGQFFTTFYAQALGNSGSATYTGTAPGYVPTTATVDLAPSGVVVTGMFGFSPFPHQASKAAGNSPLTVSTAILDPATNAFSQQQEMAGGASVTVSLTSDDPTVGTIQSPVTITGGSDRVSAQFTPLLANQMTFIRVGTPANFTTPSNFTSVVVQVLP